MIRIGNETILELNREAIHHYPDECCGFLFGKENEEMREVTNSRAVKNSSTENKKNRFEITAKDYMNGEQFALDNNLQFLGVYHSHPDHPAVPSETDRLAAQPYFSYVIISVMQDQVVNILSWRLNDDNQFEEETIQENQSN